MPVRGMTGVGAIVVVVDDDDEVDGATDDVDELEVEVEVDDDEVVEG